MVKWFKNPLFKDVELEVEEPEVALRSKPMGNRVGASVNLRKLSDDDLSVTSASTNVTTRESEEAVGAPIDMQTVPLNGLITFDDFLG